MDPFLFSSEDTFLLLARQGYAAQGRRQSVLRRSAVPSRKSTSSAISDATLSAENGFQNSVSKEQPESIDIPALSKLSDNPKADSSLYSTSPCSPKSPGMLHEQLWAQLQNTIIEEEEGDDGFIVYNGLKRLSMTEAGLVKQGRPRIVNI
ncbi:hypothetical protein IWW36_001153 [Coemansia brasiliensis]|uniref:Uncharacterized protein n=1 Tax=Coemansia brasiliensis TaxID=2650707 RepID=A0A9W8IH94_9FUNG|nr:hypothetical protein IWW36_001153 [Coemansia brasiliensis]